MELQKCICHEPLPLARMGFSMTPLYKSSARLRVTPNSLFHWDRPEWNRVLWSIVGVLSEVPSVCSLPLRKSCSRYDLQAPGGEERALTQVTSLEKSYLLEYEPNHWGQVPGIRQATKSTAAGAQAIKGLLLISVHPPSYSLSSNRDKVWSVLHHFPYLLRSVT